MQPLRAKRAEFGELPQEFGQIVGAIQPPIIKSHVVFETIYNLVLKFFHPLGFFKPVPLCRKRRVREVTGVTRRGGERGCGRGGDTDL